MDHLADQITNCVISSLVDQIQKLVKKNNEIKEIEKKLEELKGKRNMYQEIKEIEKKLEELKGKRNMYQESIYNKMLDGDW